MVEEIYIVVRVGDSTRVLFKEDFIHGNEFTTQNEIIEVLNLICWDKDFSVDLCTRIKPKEKEK